MTPHRGLQLVVLLRQVEHLVPRALVSMQVQLMRDRMRLGDTKLSTVVDPINAPVCSEPDQGNGQGEGQDQAEKLAMSPPSKVQ